MPARDFLKCVFRGGGCGQISPDILYGKCMRIEKGDGEVIEPTFIPGGEGSSVLKAFIIKIRPPPSLYQFKFP